MEKIKAIGDAYMVAASIPTPRENHAQVVARFALAARLLDGEFTCAERSVIDVNGKGPTRTWAA